MNPATLVRDFWACFEEIVADCHESVIELGCGHGYNLTRVPARKRVGVEIEESYPAREHLTGQVDFILGDAIEIAETIPDKSFELVLLIDVVEHFVKGDGAKLLKHACRIASKKVLLWIPEGKAVQDKDHFDKDGGYEYKPSQDHRSQWYRSELQSFGFEVAAWDNYHWDRTTGKKTVTALLAVADFT